jgi:hypothetical protein
MKEMCIKHSASVLKFGANTNNISINYLDFKLFYTTFFNIIFHFKFQYS